MKAACASPARPRSATNPRRQFNSLATPVLADPQPHLEHVGGERRAHGTPLDFNFDGFHQRRCGGDFQLRMVSEADDAVSTADFRRNTSSAPTARLSVTPL